MNYLVLLIAFSLTGCASLMTSLPGTISISESKVEGTKEINLNPAWCKTDWATGIKLGLFKSSKMGQEEVILTAEVNGIQGIETHDSLTLNIDGQVTRLSAIDNMTKMEMQTSSSPALSSIRYATSMEFAKKIVDGKSVLVKLNFTDHTYREADCSKDEMMSVKRSFKEFLEKAPQIK
jgi:hypothetical protein